MLTAVQIFNNPSIQFKSESFIVLAIISWTYLLHAYYRDKDIEYRYFDRKHVRRKFHTTKFGAHKYWELEKCLTNENSPIDEMTATNLNFLIGLRHEIEHKMTTKIDDLLSARFQACCLNYNNYLEKFFPNKGNLKNHLPFSLQFSSLNEEQVDELINNKGLPQNISTYIQNFDQDLSEEVFNDSRFAYRILFTRKLANSKGQADKVIEFIPEDSEIAQGLNKAYVMIKERERKKYLPSHIWNKMQGSGFPKFNSFQHTKLWKAEKAKNPSKGFGVEIANTWYWYDSWLNFVKTHCKNNQSKYV